VTRVSLHGGICPCCAKGFKAAPPVGLEPGSPFGPNLRAFVISLRSVQGIPLARLCCVLRDLFGLDISEGALVNILDAGRAPFATQAGAEPLPFLREPAPTTVPVGQLILLHMQTPANGVVRVWQEGRIVGRHRFEATAELPFTVPKAGSAGFEVWIEKPGGGEEMALVHHLQAQ
jgi:hypothetical protein